MAVGVQIEITGATRSQGDGSDSLSFDLSPSGGVDEFVGCWAPTRVDSTHIDLTTGSISDGVTTLTPDVTGIVVHATSLNYVYLECNLTGNEVDGFYQGGTIDAAIVAAYTTTKTSTATKGYRLLFEWQSGALVGTRQAYFAMQGEIFGSVASPQFRTWVSS